MLGALGDVFHGTMPEVRSGTQFMVADAYWVPPQGEPIGPMVLEVSLIALKRYVEDSK